MEGFKICPYCGKEVPIFALKCKHCKELFDENDFQIGIVDSDCNQSFICKIFNWIFNWLYEDEYARNMILGMLVVFIFCAYIALKPYTTIAYAKNNSATICHKADDSTCYKKMNILEQIEVYPEHYKKKGYLKTKQGEYIKETSITYKDTEEYKQIKTKLDKEKEEKIRKENELKKKELAESAKIFENQFKDIFSDIQIDIFYDFYINPIGWELMPIKTKELIMKYCGAYAEYKKGKLTDNMTLVKTRILNDRNGDVLGEYNSLRGFIFK